ncbi:MAG: AbrB/MazE/SpoVT family DNA-binding domain-containing protein [Deferrisomatales bacterium]
MIPKCIREHLGLAPGQKMQALAHGDRIELIPVRPAAELRGFLRGIDTAVERAEGRP